MSTNLSRMFPPALCLAFASVVSAQSPAILSGRVVSSDNKGIKDVAVHAYQQGQKTTKPTSASGNYGIELTGTGTVDYIVFEHKDYLPKVLQGPFPSTMSSEINIVLGTKTTPALSLPAMLGAIQSIQFMNVILKQPERQLPPTLHVQPELAFIAKTLGSGASTASDRLKRPGPTDKNGLWPMDDDFFAPATSTSGERVPAPRAGVTP
jgi:hypothetical protein